MKKRGVLAIIVLLLVLGLIFSLNNSSEEPSQDIGIRLSPSPEINQGEANHCTNVFSEAWTCMGKFYCACVDSRDGRKFIAVPEENDQGLYCPDLGDDISCSLERVPYGYDERGVIIACELAIEFALQSLPSCTSQILCSNGAITESNRLNHPGRGCCTAYLERECEEIDPSKLT